MRQTSEERRAMIARWAAEDDEDHTAPKVKQEENQHPPQTDNENQNLTNPESHQQ